VIDAGHQIAKIIAAPVVEDFAGKLLAVAGAAARVGGQHRVALARQYLELVDVAIAPGQRRTSMHL
jgi:hypothetical protein